PHTADLERDDPLWRQCLLQPAQELSAASRRPCSGEDRQRLIGVAGGAHVVMAQSERALVHPLEIVDRQERRLERPGSPMSGLEDSERLERRRPRRRIEEDCLQPFAVARALRESSEESRRRRGRKLTYGVVLVLRNRWLQRVIRVHHPRDRPPHKRVHLQGVSAIRREISFCLPCRRSWVRVPSAASEVPANRALLVTPCAVSRPVSRTPSGHSRRINRPLRPAMARKPARLLAIATTRTLDL